jgi:hypothetical protein
MLERPHRDRPRLIKLLGEEERAPVGGQCSGQDLLGARLRELDRTAAVEHRLLRTPIDGQGAHQPRRRLDVSIGSLRPPSVGLVGELKHPALLDRSPADQHRGSGARDRQLRMLQDHLVRKRVNPAQERPGGASSDQSEVVLHQELRDQLVVGCCGRVRDRLGRRPSRSKAFGRPSVDPCLRARLQQGELSPRVLRKQGMNAEPAAPLQPRDEQVRVLQLREPGRRIRTVKHVIAQLRGELPEDRYFFKEPAAVLVKRREDLATQVLDHEPMSPPEPPHGQCRLLDGPQPQPREDERSRPALGAPDQRLDIVRAELKTTENHQELIRLGGSECEVGDAHLDNRPSGTQRSDSQRRIRACDDHHVRVRGKVHKGVVDRRQAFLVGQRVQVVQHDDQLAPQRCYAVHELVNGGLNRAARHAKSPKRRTPEARPNPLDRRRDVPPEPNRIVIASVKRGPGQGSLEARAPHAHSRRLAIARRSRDEHQRGIATGVERPHYAWSVDHAMTQTRDRELGLNEP